MDIDLGEESACDVPFPAEKCPKMMPMKQCESIDHCCGDVPNRPRKHAPLSLSKMHWISARVPKENLTSNKDVTSAKLQHTVMKYQKAKKLLGGQVHRGGHLGKLLSREKSKNKRLVGMLRIFETKVTEQLETLRQRFESAKVEIQRLNSELHSSKTEKMRILAEVHHPKNSARSRNEDCAQVPEKFDEPDDEDWKVDVMKNGCKILQELVELVQEQNLACENGSVMALDAATQTDLPDWKAQTFVNERVFLDAAVQTISSMSVDTKNRIDKSTEPLVAITEHIINARSDSDLSSSLQKGHCNNNSSSSSSNRSKEEEKHTKYLQNRVLYLEGVLERMDHELQQERDEVIKLCSENLFLETQTALAHDAPEIRLETRTQDTQTDMHRVTLVDSWELLSSVGSLNEIEAVPEQHS